MVWSKLIYNNTTDLRLLWIWNRRSIYSSVCNNKWDKKNLLKHFVVIQFYDIGNKINDKSAKKCDSNSSNQMKWPFFLVISTLLDLWNSGKWRHNDSQNYVAHVIIAILQPHIFFKEKVSVKMGSGYRLVAIICREEKSILEAWLFM